MHRLAALTRPDEWLRFAMVSGCALALICAGPAFPF
jgi:hypothetical protein